MLDRKSWKEQYSQTTLETDRLKIQERIAGTRQAITTHLQDLERESDQHPERHQIEKVLQALAELEAETQQW
jgi:hypothetical protein